MAIDVRINPTYEWGDKARKSGLTKTEAEVIALIGQGYDNKEAADILRIQYQTVKNHIYNLTNKLNASSTCHALLIAIGENVITIINPDIDVLSDPKERNKDKLHLFLDKLLATEDTPLTKKIKKWMIRNGYDVDI